MAQKKRVNRSPKLKASIVLEVMTGKISVPQAASKYKIKDSVIYGWRNDHAPKVRAVAIAPGFIHTPAHVGIPPETIEHVKDSIPAKHGAQPEEVASLAAYLASDEADYITATGIITDGGYLGT